IPPEKDEAGSDAYDENGIVQKALRAIRESVRDLLLFTDVCLCEYTSHGHCGLMKHHDVQNDPTLKLLADASVSHVRAGADMVAPSDMMDGRVGVIRQALDSEGFTNTPIMAYSAKYASGFMVHFGKRPALHRNSATAAAIRWIRPTRAKRCVKSLWISKKE